MSRRRSTSRSFSIGMVISRRTGWHEVKPFVDREVVANESVRIHACHLVKSMDCQHARAVTGRADQDGHLGVRGLGRSGSPQ